MLANIIRNRKKTAIGGGGGGIVTDFSQISLLMHMDGVNNSTTFTDSSSNARVATAVGSPVISTAESKFGGASLNLTGTSYLTVPNATTSGLNSTDWTIETWIYMSSIPASASVFGSSNGGGSVSKFFMNINMSTSFLAQTNRVGFLIYNGGNRWINVAYTWSVNTWYHIAAVQSGSSVTLYINGQSVGTMPYTVPSGITGNFRIGTDGEAYKILAGRIDDFRVTRSALYTASFTPPTSAFPDA